MNKSKEEKVRKTLTFCLASMILASRSAGMTLPLKESRVTYLYHDYIQYIYIFALIFCIISVPLVRAQQDHVLGPKAQSSAGLLYRVVALWGVTH